MTYDCYESEDNLRNIQNVETLDMPKGEEKKKKKTKAKSSKRSRENSLNRNVKSDSVTLPKPLILPLPQVVSNVILNEDSEINIIKHERIELNTSNETLKSKIEELDNKEETKEISLTEVEKLIENILLTIHQTSQHIDQNAEVEKNEMAEHHNESIDEEIREKLEEEQDFFHDAEELKQQLDHLFREVPMISDELDTIEELGIEDTYFAENEEILNRPLNEKSVKEKTTEESSKEIDEAIRHLSTTINNIHVMNSPIKEEEHVHEELSDIYKKEQEFYSANEKKNTVEKHRRVRKSTCENDYNFFFRKPLGSFQNDSVMSKDKNNSVRNLCTETRIEASHTNKKMVPIFKLPIFLAEVNAVIDIIDFSNMLPPFAEVLEMDWKVHAVIVHVLSSSKTVVVSGAFSAVVDYVPKNSSSILSKKIKFPWEKSQKVKWVNKIELPYREKTEYLFYKEEKDDSVHHKLVEKFAEPIEQNLKETNFVWHTDATGCIQGVVKLSLQLFQLQKIDLDLLGKEWDV